MPLCFNMVTGIIYLYTSPSGKFYVGQTINEKKRRRMWFNLKRPYSKWSSKIDNARLKYGPGNFRYDILHSCKYGDVKSAKLVLNELETKYIKIYDSFRNGYNCTTGGGSTIGYVHTDDTRRKISMVHKGKKLSEEQIKFLISINTGRRHSDETKKKIGDSHRGIKFSDEARKNISKSLTGRKLSESARKNISEGHKGLKRTRESVSKSAKANEKKVAACKENGEPVYIFNSLKEAALFVNRKPSTLSVICNKSKTAYGYTWKYL